MAITTRVKIQAMAAIRAPIKEPSTPAPQLMRKATKARKQAMGWRIMAWVRPSTECRAAKLKSVPDIQRMSIVKQVRDDQRTFDVGHNNSRRISNMILRTVVLVGSRDAVQ